jgi:multiple antibiotic resistance protein
MGSAAAAFLLAFPELFSIVNPPGGAFIFNEVTAGFPAAARVRLSNRVGFYSALVMLGALWGGAYVLAFFGISLAALRLAGGAVVVVRAWDLLNTPERQEARKQEQAGSSADGPADDLAFFPLTLPITTGPGTIAVAIALGSARPRAAGEVLPFFLGASAAALAMALLIWASYRSAARISALMGASARRTVTRLSAFLLLCIGVQIMLTGAEDVMATMLAPGFAPR